MQILFLKLLLRLGWCKKIHFSGAQNFKADFFSAEKVGLIPKVKNFLITVNKHQSNYTNSANGCHAGRRLYLYLCSDRILPTQQFPN